MRSPVVSEIDLYAALQRSLDRHQSLRAEAQAAQEPRSTPPEGEDSGPPVPEGAQSRSPQYAHRVAPALLTGKREGRDDDPATQQVAYHAARAYAFHLLALNDLKAGPRAALHVLAHYELASLYWRAACSDINEINSWTLDIASELEAPHVIGPNIFAMLEWAGIDPAEIRPYGGAR